MAFLKINHSGETIKKIRRERGRTQADVAQAIGITRSSMGHIEGNRPASMKVLHAIARELDVELVRIVPAVPAVPAAQVS
ncbi:helix-turn-helix transcriptional regulator [Nonomuraea antimicrobica]